MADLVIDRYPVSEPSGSPTRERRNAGVENAPKAFQKILETVPLGRLGETEEAAHFVLSLLDGHNLYTTGNFFPVAGGFNNAGMVPFG